MKRFRSKQAQDPIISLTRPVGSLTYVHGDSQTIAQTYAADTKGRNIPYKKIIKRLVIALIAAVIIVSGWFGWKIYSNAVKITGDRNPFHLLGNAKLKNTDGYVNILLAGYSADDPGHSGSTLTDSIMVISIDQSDNSALVVSIPRDLWVSVPGEGSMKINAVYPTGESSKFSEDGYANGGMGLLEKTVTNVIGLDINYYALINYTAFKDAVNAVGGITIDLSSTDNPYGLYDPYTNIDLPNGVVTLNGQTALNLARARGDGPGAYGFPRSDFNRTEHQRQMLVALKDKAASSGVLTNLSKLSQLADAAGNNITTDMQTNELGSFVSLIQNLPTDKIITIGLNSVDGKNLLKSYTAPGGASALIPAAGINNYTVIQQTLADIINPPTPTLDTD